MKLPMRAFWLLSGNINRLRAEEDLRSLTIAAAAQQSEFAQEQRKSLIEEMGEVTKGAVPGDIAEDERKAGIATLKALM